jgi:hypothetical protein
MAKKLFISVIIGTLVYFVFGWLVFDFILGDYTNINTTQLIGFKKNETQYSLTFLVVSCLSYATLISFIFIYLINIKTILKGFLIGSIIGVLVAIMADTYWYATSNFYSNDLVILFDILGAGLTVGILGLVTTLVNKIVD